MNMEKSEFDNLLKEISINIKENKKVINQALNQELSKGNSIKIEAIYQIIKNFEIREDCKEENQDIAVCYSGNPEITITYILDSIIYNNKVILCVNENKIITEVLVNIILDSIKKCGLKNDWIRYSSNYNEIYLRDNKNKFNKIVFIGDYFEYERLKNFLKRDIEYNNYGYIKLFIDKSKYKEEYNKIMQFSYSKNIYLEVYNDIQDFINESKKEDFSIVYIDDFKSVNKMQKELKSEELLINTFPYDSYKFKVKR